ncbi:hypothetical protein BC828DRAFT_277082 [Blastocladiella britannica]|nr:hypothetical protein BC828DRAFT_277082 [Blastocladiella britannica]
MSVAQFIDVCGSRVTQIVCHVARLVDADPSAKVVVFCEYLQQLNLIHDALLCAGVSSVAAHQGSPVFAQLYEFKTGRAYGSLGDHATVKHTSVLVMPYSMCEPSLNLVEASHIVKAHPYAGADLAMDWIISTSENSSLGRAHWSEERWAYEHLKWREIEHRAMACVVRPGQTRSVQVVRFYAADTLEAWFAKQFGDPMSNSAYPGKGIVAALAAEAKALRVPRFRQGSGRASAVKKNNP